MAKKSILMYNKNKDKDMNQQQAQVAKQQVVQEQPRTQMFQQQVPEPPRVTVTQPKEVTYLILGYIMGEIEEEKIWEIIENKELLYKYLKINYEVLDLDNTNIYVVNDDIVNISDNKGVTAYNMLKTLQEFYNDDQFDIDELIENNVY